MRLRQPPQIARLGPDEWRQTVRSGQNLLRLRLCWEDRALPHLKDYAPHCRLGKWETALVDSVYWRKRNLRVADFPPRFAWAITAGSAKPATSTCRSACPDESALPRISTWSLERSHASNMISAPPAG